MPLSSPSKLLANHKKVGRVLLGAFALGASAGVHADPTDQVSCYQNGTLVYKSAEKTYAELANIPDGALKLIADFTNDQTREVRTRLYSNAAGTLVCVITSQR